MNECIIEEISKNLNITEKQIKTVLTLLSEGNTIPFIARYRKEATGSLDEEQIRSINEVYEYQQNLLKRKEDVIRLIDEKGLLTPELKEKIMKCEKLVDVEDLYRPFKEKKKTKATEAINNGLEGLAKIIMSFPIRGNIETTALKYLNDKVKSVEDAVMGAQYIIAEWISDNASYRKYIRNYTFKNGNIVTKKKKNIEDDDKVYEMYYDYSEAIKYIKPHRYLAICRAEKEKIISVSFDINKDDIYEYLEKKLIKNSESFVCDIVRNAIKDSYKRLIAPSIEREIRSELFEISEDKAIQIFSKNLEKLLLTPPMKDKIVLGLDPAFRTGCKLAVLDYTGKPLDISVIYPHEPKNLYNEAKTHVLKLIDKFNIDIIAIGNGTASRESESFIADVIKSCRKNVEYIIVSEAGASVYSASKLAINEFPNLHVEERSAISIGRRLQDPLSELVKIDTKSIGVGQYQHDVSNKKLNSSLDFVVEKAVNMVGVNINTASRSLLSYVSGLNKKIIDNILEYRDKFGKILSRDELKKVPNFVEKAYEQSIGFMRIVDGKNILDSTSIHPESYSVTYKLLDKLNIDINKIGSEDIEKALSNIDILSLSKELNVDKFTLEDIINNLKKPMRDPRDDFEKPILKSDILKLEDLRKGMKLQGTVRNVVDFGAFIDIGLKNDGLAHISKLTTKYIKHPLDILNVGDIVDCYVEEIYLDKKKVALTLIDPNTIF